MKTTFRQISIYSNKNVAVLAAQISAQLAIVLAVKSVLPKDLAAHVVHGLRQPKKLIIFTDSPAWAAKLRYYQTAMLTACAASTTEAIGFQVKVLNNFFAKTKPTPPIIPSLAVIEEIKALGIRTEDEQLKNALTRLGTTLSLVKEKG